MAKTMQTPLRCAVPERTRPLWESAGQPLRVVMSFRYAVYLETAGGQPLALCSRDAAAMPFSAVLPVTSGDLALPSEASDARIGDGVLTVGSVQVRPGRYTRPPVAPSHLTPRALERYAALARTWRRSSTCRRTRSAGARRRSRIQRSCDGWSGSDRG